MDVLDGQTNPRKCNRNFIGIQNIFSPMSCKLDQMLLQLSIIHFFPCFSATSLESTHTHAHTHKCTVSAYGTHEKYAPLRLFACIQGSTSCLNMLRTAFQYRKNRTIYTAPAAQINERTPLARFVVIQMLLCTGNFD